MIHSEGPPAEPFGRLCVLYRLFEPRATALADAFQARGFVVVQCSTLIALERLLAAVQLDRLIVASDSELPVVRALLRNSRATSVPLAADPGQAPGDSAEQILSLTASAP